MLRFLLFHTLFPPFASFTPSLPQPLLPFLLEAELSEAFEVSFCRASSSPRLSLPPSSTDALGGVHSLRLQ